MHQKSAKKREQKEKHLKKAPTKLENKEKGEKVEQQKKAQLEGKASRRRQSETM